MQTSTQTVSVSPVMPYAIHPVDMMDENDKDNRDYPVVSEKPCSGSSGSFRPIRLVSTKGMSRESWLQYRQLGIGSSDASVVLGLSPYKSPLALWLEKTRQKEAEDISEKEAVFWGTTLEAIVADVYGKRTGSSVRRINAMLQHPRYPFMLANLDRVVHHPTDGQGILEVKTAGFRSAHLWEEGVPEGYQCQVLHQLAVTGKPWADVAVLIGGQDFRVYRLFRDEEKIDALIRMESQFWHGVENGIAPLADETESSKEALSYLYPSDNGETVDLSENKDANRLFEWYLKMKQECDTSTALFKEAKHQLLQRIKGASTVLFAKGKMSYKQVKESLTTDYAQLAKAHPDLLAQFQTTKTGYRRLTVSVYPNGKV